MRSSSSLCFFFSSRRRHTRFKCDWSSDVCSSDLLLDDDAGTQHDGAIAHHAHDVEIVADKQESEIVLTPELVEELQHHRLHGDVERSEERRVGKEWRSRSERGGTYVMNARVRA